MSEISSDVLSPIAARLRAAGDSGLPIAPIRDEIGAGNISAAYAIQQINTNFGLKQGRVICGRKIGLTSLAVQKQLGVDQPDYGVLFSDMLRTEVEEIDLSRFIAPRIETEIAMIVNRDLDNPALTMVDLLRSIEYVLPALEIVDSRIADWNIRITDTIADNASCGLMVLGNTKAKLDGLDLRTCGMVMENQTGPVSFGTGAACLGNPLNACLWLARKLLEHGSALREGDLILSGALGPMVNIKPGDRYMGRVGNIGTVMAQFATPSAS
jgi:2-keto-4-pentenoate hydratase